MVIYVTAAWWLASVAIGLALLAGLDEVVALGYPVVIGAAMAESWLPKFRIPPNVPTDSLGAINDGMDQPTGAAAANPPIDILIQNNACAALWE